MERAPGGWDADHPRLVAAAEAVTRVLVAPLLLAYRLRLIQYYAAGELVSLVPGALGLLVRRVWYRATLESCGERLRMAMGTVITKSGARVGSDCYFGPMNRVGRAVIGDNFLSADHVTILSGRHQHGYSSRDLPMRWQKGTPGRLVVGDDVWAGSHVVIAADVADHTLIATSAAVTQTFPEWSIIGGVPAKVIGERP